MSDLASLIESAPKHLQHAVLVTTLTFPVVAPPDPLVCIESRSLDLASLRELLSCPLMPDRGDVAIALALLRDSEIRWNKLELIQIGRGPRELLRIRTPSCKVGCTHLDLDAYHANLQSALLQTASKPGHFSDNKALIGFGLLLGAVALCRFLYWR